jgi:hypothetical protein
VNEDDSISDSSSVHDIHSAEHNWPVRKITGRKYVNGEWHYWVNWTRTLMPKHLLRHAMDLVDEFERGLHAQRGVKNKLGETLRIEADAAAGQQPKRQRGRPKKHK